MEMARLTEGCGGLYIVVADLCREAEGLVKGLAGSEKRYAPARSADMHCIHIDVLSTSDIVQVTN